MEMTANESNFATQIRQTHFRFPMKRRLLHIIVLIFATGLPHILCTAQESGFRTGIRKIFDNINEVDTSYVAPRNYVWTTKAIGQSALEIFNIKTDNDFSFKFKSHPTVSFGPSIGYQFVSGAYTYDFNVYKNGTGKKELEAHMYMPMFCADVFFRQTGGDYIIKSIGLPGIGTTEPDFNTDGLFMSVDRIGANLFYIFNHHRYSSSAAFNSVATQLRSAGSFITGIGYSRSTVKNNLGFFVSVYDLILDNDVANSLSSSCDMFSKLTYDDFTLWGGYGYNWVPARHILLSAVLNVGVGLKREEGTNSNLRNTIQDFEPGLIEMFDPYIFVMEANNPFFCDHALGINMQGRVSAQYNNQRFFAGAQLNVNNYYNNRQHASISTNNTFGTLSLFAGIHF